MATAKERTKLSRLELLPAELRTLIYTYLGFPTSKVFDLHCPHAYPSDYTNSSSSQALCPGWTPGSIRLAGIRMPDAKCLVTDPIFINTKTGDEIVRADICGRKGCEFRPLKKDRWMKVATRLMGASSSFYDELSHIMYSGLRIEIGFELSEYAVHTKYKRQHAFEKDERGG